MKVSPFIIGKNELANFGLIPLLLPNSVVVNFWNKVLRGKMSAWMWASASFNFETLIGFPSKSPDD